MRDKRSAAFGVLAILLIGLASSAGAAQGRTPGKPVVFAGTLEVTIEDYFDQGRSIDRFFLHEANLEQRFELRLRKKQQQDLKHGAVVRVRGRLEGNVLTADADDAAVETLAEAAAAAPVTARRVIVILVNIRDSANVLHAVNAICDDASATAAKIVYGYNATGVNVEGVYEDSSFGKMGWGGSAYPGTPSDVVRVEIADEVSACNDASWRSKADAIVGTTKLSQYQHRLYVMPTDISCGWAGYGQVGCGSNCWAMSKSYSSQPCGYNDTHAHELGHNVGFRHASTDVDNDGVLDATCPHLGGGFNGDYCDDSDFMGISRAKLRTQNGPHKAQLGWVTGAGLVDGTAGGTFTINALETAGATLPQVVKLTPATGLPYYLSYRVKTGYDTTELPTVSDHLYADRLNIHRYNGSNTYFIKTLGAGESFTGSGFTVTVNSRDASSINLTVGTSTVCNRLAPTAALSPSSQSTGTLPATKSYTLTVTNRDSASCGSTVFNLASSVPAGWTGGLTPTQLTLGAGAAGTSAFAVTAPAGTADASYPVNASTVADANHAAASAGASFVVASAAPPAPTNVTATYSRNKVQVAWSAASGAASYRVFRSGAQVATGVLTTTYSDAAPNGTWTYTVAAVNAAGAVSAQSAPSNAVTVKKGR